MIFNHNNYSITLLVSYTGLQKDIFFVTIYDYISWREFNTLNNQYLRYALDVKGFVNWRPPSALIHMNVEYRSIYSGPGMLVNCKTNILNKPY